MGYHRPDATSSLAGQTVLATGGEGLVVSPLARSLLPDIGLRALDNPSSGRRTRVPETATDHVGKAFSVGTGTSASIRKLAEFVREGTGGDSEVFHTEAREGDIEHSRADISKAEAVLGYEALPDSTPGWKRSSNRDRQPGRSHRARPNL